MLRPNYEEMSGSELLAAYNAMAEKPRTSKFQTKDEAVRKCNVLWAQKSGTLKVVEGGGNGAEVTLDPSPEKESYPAPAPRKRRSGTKSEVKAAMLVQLQAKALEANELYQETGNPRRAGTGAHEAFEILKKSKTRGDYFMHFTGAKERKDANLRLVHNIKDGFVKLVKA